VATSVAAHEGRGPGPGLGLDEQLCFSLYAASRAVRARYRPLLDALGLTYPQYLVMLVLWESGPVTVRGLGRRLLLDSGTLSPVLKRLEGSGLVTRRRGVPDERSVEVALTPAGRALRARAEGIPPQIAEATGLDRTEFVRLVSELEALTARLSD
jgi:DNA-binding MarR family transcriptional regulator